MKKTSRTLMVAAAMTGLISGTVIQQSQGDPTNTAPGNVAPVKKAPAVHDCSGQNDCKGIGGCKTESHSCKFQNACKGKGGCALSAADIKAWEKKQQEDAAKIKDPSKQVCATKTPAHP